MNQHYLLGVDGGGTKTLALISEVSSNADYKIIGRGTAGSTNINAVGWEKATANLELAVENAWNSAEKQPVVASYAVLALAGAGQENVKVQFVNHVREKRLAEASRVIHDAEAVLRAGSTEGWGVALIAGTGSVAFGMDQSEKLSVSGGWGFWFGDEGSAFWLGQSALKSVSKATDGRGPSTSLQSAIQNRLRVEEPRGILQSLSADSNVRLNIATLADLVIAEAEQGDEVATTIVNTASMELARLVQSASEKLSLGTQFPLALAGGVLCNSAMVREGTIRELEKLGVAPSSIEVVEEPARGALNLAHKLSCGQ